MSTPNINPTGPRHPEVFVQLSGEDGNVGSIMGRVARALRDADVPGAEITEFRVGIFDCGSYDETLAWVMSWVEVG